MKLLPLPLSALALVTWLVAGTHFAHAQSVPQTLFGTITDEAGPVPSGVPVEAYIGNTLCGTGQTEYTGDGDARVTAYAVDVFANGDTAGELPGCGRDGETVRVKIGDRFANQTAVWRAGPMRLDVVFGERATPAPLPTFTPVPPTPTPGGETPTTEAETTPTTDAATTPEGTPGTEEATGTVTVLAASPSPDEPGSTATGTATLEGGVSSATAGGGGGDDGGVPLWGIVMVVLGAVALAGGGAGVLLARSRSSSVAQ